ncbi:hypothetical protein BDQ17DRAFT_1333146 [Cyathus striatus]|nr:hypothetical protein BDQ17DRAFT_1333146 [Cyathus striatus]
MTPAAASSPQEKIHPAEALEALKTKNDVPPFTLSHNEKSRASRRKMTKVDVKAISPLSPDLTSNPVSRRTRTKGVQIQQSTIRKSKTPSLDLHWPSPDRVAKVARGGSLA